jgi:hypothetical protein
MTTAMFSAPMSNSTDANFRSWGSQLAAALGTVGMVKTADTGQINWATVVAPTSTSFAGYEVWRFNDAVQATQPLFVRVEYGSTGAQSAPTVRLQMGKGSSGAGALTGTFGTALSISTASSNAALFPCYVSSDGSTLVIVLVPNQSGGPYTIYHSVERSRSGTGQATGVAVSHTTGNGSGGSAPRPQVYNYATGALAPQNITSLRECAAMPASSGGLAVGGTAPVFFCLFTDGQGTYWQPRGCVWYLLLDAGSFTQVDVPGYGTYLPMGAQMTNLAGQSLMIAWS